MASLNSMVRKVAGLLGTNDLTAWETAFVRDIVAQTNEGNNTSSLTEKQVEALESIHDKHFVS